MNNNKSELFDTFRKNPEPVFSDKILSGISQPSLNQGGALSQIAQFTQAQTEQQSSSAQNNGQENNGSSNNNATISNDVKNSLSLVTERRDIILENDINNQRYLMPSIEVKFLQSPENSLFFSDLIERLKQMNFPLNDCMLFCWDAKRGMHVFVANDPMNQPHFLPSHLCGVERNIYIKFRSYKQQPVQQQFQYGSGNQRIQQGSNQLSGGNNGSVNPSIKEEDQIISDENTNFSQQQNNMGGVAGCGIMDGGKISRKKKIMGGRSNDKRVKERYIEKVREKVGEWRAMHETGFRDSNGNLQKLNLDHAANYIGISRKTLDDYYLQLRRAEQLGFDFERNNQEKMGTLRKFVKEESKRQAKKNQANNSNNNNNNNNGGSTNFDSNLNPLSGCDNSDEDESSQEINCATSNTPSSKNNNNNKGNTSNNNNNNNKGNNAMSIVQSINQSNYNVNPALMAIQSSNPNHNQPLLTPFNHTNSGTFPYSSGGLNAHNSYGQQHSQGGHSLMQTSFGQGFSQNQRNSYMVQEQIGSTGLESLSRNSNNLNFNGQAANNIFNPGSQFLNNGNNHYGGNLSDFNNNIMGEGLNQGSNVTAPDHRFSNQFFISGFTNNSQIIDERNSLNFITNGLNNHNSLANADNRQSNGSYMNMEDSFITTTVNNNNNH